MKNLSMIIDFETTGVDPESCEIIEFAYILCDENLNVLMSASHLIKPINRLPKEIVELTGITDDMLKFGTYLSDYQQHFPSLLKEVKTIIAHNGINFDFQILKRLGCDLSDKVLVDTLIHLPLKKTTTSKRLNHLCADYEIFLTNGHRALNDCQALHSLLSKFDFQEIVNRAKSKIIDTVAIVSYEKKEIVKKLGFMWQDGKWRKQVLECEIKQLENTLKQDDISIETINK